MVLLPWLRGLVAVRAVRNFSPQPVNNLLNAVGLKVIAPGILAYFGGVGEKTFHGGVWLVILFGLSHFGVDGDVLDVWLAMSIKLRFAALVHGNSVRTSPVNEFGYAPPEFLC